jgi:hypothetical protein
MKTLQDERLRAAARDHLAAEARRARTAGHDDAVATRAGATARGAATMPGKQGAIIGLGIPLSAILQFPQGIIPALLKLAHADRDRQNLTSPRVRARLSGAGSRAW